MVKDGSMVYFKYTRCSWLILGFSHTIAGVFALTEVGSTCRGRNCRLDRKYKMNLYNG